MRRKVVITGGSGNVATMMRPHLDDDFDVVLADIVAPSTPLGDRERFVDVTIADLDALTDAFESAHLVVHLAGFPQERTWPEIVETNITGTYNVLEAARRARVDSVLLASSIHAVGFASVDEARSSSELPPRPDTFYGVAKAALEALGRLYADRFDMTVVSARIGTAEPHPSSARSLSTWISPADLARLVAAVASTDQRGGHVIWAISANTRRWTTTGAGERIGFHPLDDAEVAAGAVDTANSFTGDTRLGAAFTTLPLGEAW